MTKREAQAEAAVSQAQAPHSPASERPRSRRVVFFTLVALLLVVLGLVLLVFWRFLIGIGIATAMALMLKPLHVRLTKSLGQRAGASSAFLVLGVTVIILLPVVLLLVMVASQALTVYNWVMPQLTSDSLERVWHDLVPQRFPWVVRLQELMQGRLSAFLTEVLSTVANALNGLLQGAVASLSTAIFHVALLLIMLFFFLRDGSIFRAALRRVSPLSREQADTVIENLTSTMQGALASLMVVPIVQGTLATIGYWALGVPSALLWGAITTLVAFIPAIGTPLVWAPICVYLWFHGQHWQSIALAVWGAVAVMSIDNFLRPMLLKGAARIHPLWSFLAILGGMFSFGVLGLIVGPLILSLGVSALRIYEMDILRGKPLAVPAPVPAPVPQREA